MTSTLPLQARSRLLFVGYVLWSGWVLYLHAGEGQPGVMYQVLHLEHLAFRAPKGA